MKKNLLAGAFLLSAMTSFGGGYDLNLQGLRQLAMGGTGTAIAWDASTIFYNPAGMSDLKSIQVYADVVAVMPTTAFGNSMGSAVSKPQTFTPFSFYVGGPIQQGSKFAVGLGIYTPAGLGIAWPDNWQGSNIVQSVQFSAFFFQPTISYQVNDFLSVGGGFVYGIGTFDFKSTLPVESYVGNNDTLGSGHLHGTATGAGFNLGVHLKINDNLQIGLNYRSQVNMGISSGSATFSVPSALTSEFPATHFDSDVPIPQVASIGVGWKTGKLTLQFDLNYTGWNSFDSLRINFAENTAALQNEHAPRHYRNTLTPRAGANYKISKIVSLMAGAYFDPTPVVNGFVSPDLPDANRIGGSCGISVKPWPRLTVLAALEGVSSLKRNATYDYAQFDGTYKTEVISLGLGFYYNL